MNNQCDEQQQNYQIHHGCSRGTYLLMTLRSAQELVQPYMQQVETAAGAEAQVGFISFNAA